MGRRLAARRDRLPPGAEVGPRTPRGVLPRLGRFPGPPVELLRRSERGRHARTYVAGLLSGLEYKNVGPIAYPHDRGRRAGYESFGVRESRRAPADPRG